LKWNLDIHQIFNVQPSRWNLTVERSLLKKVLQDLKVVVIEKKNAVVVEKEAVIIEEAMIIAEIAEEVDEDQVAEAMEQNDEEDINVLLLLHLDFFCMHGHFFDALQH
jgi:hypothetical protein